MFESFHRSMSLVRHSWEVLKKDREIMVFPIVSGICSTLAALSFIIPLAMFGLAGEKSMKHLDAVWYVLTFLFYLVTYGITIFFNVAVMTCAAKRMDGGDPTVKDGFKGAMSHLPSILAWSAVSATVGMLLRMLEERSALLGKIVSSVLGLAWTFLTFFVVPVMIFEGVGVRGAVNRSATLFKKTWGEAVVGSGGMGMVFGLLALLGVIPLILAGMLISSGTIGIAAAVMLGSIAVIYWIALGVISSALTGIFHVALYRYATTGRVPSDYPEELVTRQWHPKG